MITAEQIEDLYTRGGSIQLHEGESFTRDDLVTYIKACDIDTADDGTPLDDQWQLLADVLGAPDPSNVSELSVVAATVDRMAVAEYDRDEAIRAALKAGHSAIAVANAADLSRARVYQIRDGRR